ncbi:hypothetical protein TELCIR_24394, partial [Teladorsagia circumcincta]
AWQDFCSSLCQLHNAPRLRHPVWLSLLERDQNENVVVADFCKQLTRLVEKLDTKHTNLYIFNDEAPYMPYNAQIAQYLEISGSVGSVHRMAK